MASAAAFDIRPADDAVILASPDDPSTPHDAASQVTLPSTEEVPASPMDAGESFRTEVNDDRRAASVIASSLTPPPSTQVTVHDEVARRTCLPSQQQSALCSPPATILQILRDREPGTDYAPPIPHQILNAPADELRFMLQTCIAEQQKLKMETAHHKLQYNLLSLQSEDDAQRSLVEYEMMRREVDALRTAEHSRQARRELSTTADSTQVKYLQMKLWYEAAMEENESLHRRLKVAKKLIRQKEEETIHMTEERDILLTRIRENREHFHMMCSPGGIFHGAMAPRQDNGSLSLSSSSSSVPQQYGASHQEAQDRHHHQRHHRSHHRHSHTHAHAHAHAHVPRSLEREGEGEETEGERERDGDREVVNGHEHGLSALLQAMSQSQSQDQNNSAPSTPATSHRSAQKKYTCRHVHSRNAQSMSSLPSTPLPWSRVGGLLPSADLVPQTEPPRPPRQQHAQQQQFVPATPNSARDWRRKSRESTISVDDNEELARQALESVEGFPSFASCHHRMARTSPPPPPPAPPVPSRESLAQQRIAGDDDNEEDGEVFDSQASQAAAELLRRHAPGGSSLDREMAHAAGSRDGPPTAAEQSMKLQAKLLSNPHARGDTTDKRKYGGHGAAAAESARREHGSPAKRARTAVGLSEERRIGLGIQYGR
ncbi:hypothetical protein E4U42_000508 [Claviceps africana]|uniref:FAD-dependent oxidoreductase-like enzyme n=1 Tax=Claviceps africana TaxID=83212 RepID=A0A8K0JAN6_9HYPO|nr:hypothetical protein E4U42_000508 [Claviceps africana]